MLERIPVLHKLPGNVKFSMEPQNNEEQTYTHTLNEETEKPQENYYDKMPKFGNKGPSKLRQHFNRGLTSFLVVACCIMFYFLFLRFSVISEILGKIFGILKPIIYGFVIAYLLNPIVKFVEAHVEPILIDRVKKKDLARKASRGVGIVIGLIIGIALVVALCNMVIPELYKSIRDLIITLPDQLNDMVEKISRMSMDDSTMSTIIKNVVKEGTDALQTWLKTDLMKQTNIIMTNLTAGMLNVISEIMNGVIGIIVSVYVLFSKEAFGGQSKKTVYALMKPDHANMVIHLTRKSNEIFGGFIIGKIIDSTIIGIICFICLSIMDMPYTVLVSVIVGVTNVIPFFGPYIGAVPSAILIMLSNPMKGLYFIIFILILQQVDGNIIGPKILGDSTGLSAFWVVVSILLGGGMFGFVGMIMGVPTFAVLYYIADMILNQKLERKKLPTDWEYYNQVSYVDESGMFRYTEDKEKK